MLPTMIQSITEGVARKMFTQLASLGKRGFFSLAVSRIRKLNLKHFSEGSALRNACTISHISFLFALASVELVASLSFSAS